MAYVEIQIHRSFMGNRDEILFKTTAVNMTRNTGMTYPVYAK
jgi:hypothetical protein